MKLLIVGATGPLGQLIVRAARRRGHEITALVRNPASVPAGLEDVQIVQGDILQTQAVHAAVQGQTAVICSLGSKISFQPITMLSEGTLNILTAMRQASVSRLVCITGIGAGDSRGHGGFVYDRIVQPLLLREVYEDKTRQEEVIKRSDSSWTIIRPAQLTNKGALGDGNYKVIQDLTGVTAKSIPRADVAEFTIEQAQSGKFLHETVLLTT